MAISVLRVTRKAGDTKPVSVKVTYPTSYDLTSVPITFWMDADDGTAKIAGADATAEDITPATAGTTPQTVWRLSYAFSAADLDTLGTFKAEFQADFGAGNKHYYPDNSDLVVVVIAHPASS